MRRLTWAVVVAALAILGWRMAAAPAAWQAAVADIYPYREAAFTLASGRSPYGEAAIGPSGMRYLYPPTFLLLFGPVLTQPALQAFAWWSMLHLPLLVGLGWCVVRAAPTDRGGPEVALGLCAALLFAPAWREVVEGQVNALVMLALAGGWSLVLAGRPGWGGASLALAAHVKVLPLVALAVLIAQARWRAAGSMVLGLLVWVPLGGLIGALTGAWGPGGIPVLDLWAAWWREQVVPVTTDTGGWVVGEFTAWNHSFAAVAHRWFDPAVAEKFGFGLPGLELPRALLRSVAGVLALGVMVTALVLARRRRDDAVAGWTALGLASLAAQFGHVQTWTHHLLSLALLVPAWTLAWAGRNELPAAQRWLMRTAGGLYLALFVVPAVLGAILPQAAGNVVYRIVYDAGRPGLPTFVVALVAGVAWSAVRVGRTGCSRVEDRRHRDTLHRTSQSVAKWSERVVQR